MGTSTSDDTYLFRLQTRLGRSPRACHEDGITAIVDRSLDPMHRDDVDGGCPSAALGSSVLSEYWPRMKDEWVSVLHRDDTSVCVHISKPVSAQDFRVQTGRPSAERDEYAARSRMYRLLAAFPVQGAEFE